jgi:ABC-type Zn2+ transport system substrate-binding protein/surface adhesin
MKKTLLTMLCSGIMLVSIAAEQPAVIASTPWTAAFADIAGLDNVPSLAPADMKHPPEYELTVSDIRKVSAAKFMIYAGYERMMKTLADASGTAVLVKINTDNSTATVESQAELIAAQMHTEKACEERVASYRKTVADGKTKAAEKGLASKKILVHAMQVYLAEDLGLTVAGTFGPGPATAAQIAKAKAAGYDIIIDNIHNPVAGPLAEVCPGAKLVMWRNFPAETGRGALERVVQQNVAALLK